jgi:hypothetical protein
MPIDQSYLRPNSAQPLAVTYHPDGQIARVYSSYTHQDTTRSVEIVLNPAQLAGSAEERRSATFDPTAEPEVNYGYDPDHDIEEPTPEMRYEEWVRSWIDTAYETGAAFSGFRCSFCGKEKSEVSKLIAGPMVYICNECVELCVEIIKEAS